MRGLSRTTAVHFKQGRGTRKVMKEGEAPEAQPPGAVLRISRLMALAIRMQELVVQGEVADYADPARLAHVSRARITQIMSLLLAPDIQEAILFLPRDAIRTSPVSPRLVRGPQRLPESP